MEEDIKKLLEQNIALTSEVMAKLDKINRYIFWQRLTSIIYLILILAPLIFAAFYLPPLINTYLGQYKDVLDTFK